MTRTRIIDVASRLLTEAGPGAVTTRSVAENAGVQAPMIYRLFGDKDGLLEAVAEHVMTTYVAAKSQTLQEASDADVPPLEDLRAGWNMQIDFGLANPGVFRLLADPRRALTSPAARAGKRVLEARVHRVAVTGRLRIGEQRAVDLIHAAGVGTIQTLLATDPADRDAGLAQTMFDAVLGAIITDGPAGADAGPIAAAVALRAVAPGLDMLTEAERQLLDEWLARVVDAL